MNIQVKNKKSIIETIRSLEFSLKVVDDSFAYELHLGCFILSWDILNDWVLFLNVGGDYRWLADTTPVMKMLESIGNRAIIFVLDRVGVVVKRGQWNVEWLGKYSFYAVCSEGDGPARWGLGWLDQWLCPCCSNPIKSPVWACHAEENFCSEKCATLYVYGECQAHTV